MKITAGKESITYSDIMLGEVWLCSGQSNMEFQLKNSYGYKAEQKDAANVPVRQFLVQKKISLGLESEVSGQWTIASANTIGDYTAVGYFYAKKLAQNLHVTVGIINSSWGGTEAEDWISRDGMLNAPELGAVVSTLPQNNEQLQQRAAKQLKAWAYHNAPVVNYTPDELAARPASFFESWQKGNAPGSWEWIGKLYSYRGEGFMQRSINLDDSYTTAASVISLGITDADMDVYINGKLVNKGTLPANYQLNLPAGTWKPGVNSLLINLKSAQKNPSWFGTGLNGAGNDLNIRFADTLINIADGNWRVMPDLNKPYHFDFLPNSSAFSLYNGMVNPLISFAIAGVLWYQGESNADRAYQYRTVFPLLINDWRSKWKEQFPFLFVQISSFGTTQNSNFGSNWAELREAQNMALKLPNTGVAITTDIGDAFNIHPKDKADVGYRLANVAFSKVYHLPGFAESPLFGSADFGAGYAMVNFMNADAGLMAKDLYGYVKGFELAGADHKFYYAQATISGNKVKVWCNAVPNPVAVRYGWTNAPIDANLFSTQGLPVSPFRSDNWDGITISHKFE
jgi:sialate O-acetylesterase